MKGLFKFNLFPKKNGTAPKKNAVQPNPATELPQAREQADSFERLKETYFAELLFPVPGLQNMPMSWCRNYLLERVGSNIRAQAFKIIGIIVIFIVISIAVALSAYSLYEFSNNQINNRLEETKTALALYSDEITSAMNLNGILDYVSEISVEDQMKGIIKITVESGIITHGVRFGKNIADIPNDVRNNFETASAVKFEDVGIIGIWYVDGTFANVSPDSQPANEEWLLETNQKLKQLYKGSGLNMYLDISAKRTTAKDGQNRNEFIIVFWK